MPIPEGFDLAAEATKVLGEAVATLRAGHPSVDIRTCRRGIRRPGPRRDIQQC
jgi:hypothetical protein